MLYKIFHLQYVLHHMSSNNFLQHLFDFEDLSYGFYWMLAVKRGRYFIQNKKGYISKLYHCLFSSNNKKIITEILVIFINSLFVYLCMCLCVISIWHIATLYNHSSVSHTVIFHIT